MYSFAAMLKQALFFTLQLTAATFPYTAATFPQLRGSMAALSSRMMELNVKVAEAGLKDLGVILKEKLGKDQLRDHAMALLTLKKRPFTGSQSNTPQLRRNETCRELPSTARRGKAHSKS